VAVLAMRHGKANALDTELCQALCGALDDDAAAGGGAALVLTGVGTVFSAGMDLKRVTAGRQGMWLPSCPGQRRGHGGLRVQDCRALQRLGAADRGHDPLAAEILIAGRMLILPVTGV
jgi:enoyl-CoA hydratase/carnithine racemase